MVALQHNKQCNAVGLCVDPYGAWDWLRRESRSFERTSRRKWTLRSLYLSRSPVLISVYNVIGSLLILKTSGIRTGKADLKSNMYEPDPHTVPSSAIYSALGRGAAIAYHTCPIPTLQYNTFTIYASASLPFFCLHLPL